MLLTRLIMTGITLMSNIMMFLIDLFQAGAAHVERGSRGCRVRCMPTFVLRLIAPRPNFAQTLTDAEREIMNRHAAHWRPYLERGDMVVFGPILTDDDSYGLAVVETDDEQALRDFAAQDPVVTTGTAAFEFGRMAAGHVRGTS
jgi:uncharacterized protein